ncbi:MAG: transcriptional repressor LexA [bacterium]|nr:transcriptional repressor LexA [bacterium]
MKTNDTHKTRTRLTKRQAEILEFICQSVQLRGFPPSIREIGEAVGLSSSSTVHSHLQSLEEKNYIRRNPSKPRSIEVVDWPKSGSKVVDVPIHSKGSTENATISLPVELVGDADSFLYRIDSERYKQEAIMPGDLLIINPGQDAKEGDMVLASTKSDMAELKKRTAMDSDKLIGKVVGVIRQLDASK